MRKLLAAVCATTLIGLFGCGGGKLITESTLPELDYVVVEGSAGFTVSIPQFYEWMNNGPYVRGGGTLTKEEARSYLDSMLIDTLSEIKAAALDLRPHRRYYRTYRLRYEPVLISRFFQMYVVPRVSVDSQEVVDYYQAHPEVYELPEQVAVHHILISTEGLLHGPDSARFTGQPMEVVEHAAESLAFFVYDLVTDTGRKFGDIAREYSHDADAKTTRGYIGWQVRNVFEPPFDSLAFGSYPGEISKPYHTANGWHILLVENKISGGIPPLVDTIYKAVEATVSQLEYATIANQVADSLSYDVDLRYNESMLDSAVFTVDDWQWAAILNERDTVFFYHLKGYEMTYRGRYDVAETTPAIKKEMIHEAVEHIRLVQAAQDMQIDTLPDVKQAEADFRVKYAKSYVMESSIDPDWIPPDSLIERYYQEHFSEFKVDKPYSVQHIIFEDSILAEFVRDQARAGNNFLDLAEQYYPGDESVRRKLADLGEIGPSDVTPEFWAMTIKYFPGDITPPVKTKYGYHIINIVGYNPTLPMDKALSVIVPRLRDRHQIEVFEAYKSKLYDEFQVEFVGQLHPMHLKPLRSRKSGE